MEIHLSKTDILAVRGMASSRMREELDCAEGRSALIEFGIAPKFNHEKWKKYHLARANKYHRIVVACNETLNEAKD